jgi:hypothetical protein
MVHSAKRTAHMNAVREHPQVARNMQNGHPGGELVVLDRIGNAG